MNLLNENKYTLSVAIERFLRISRECAARRRHDTSGGDFVFVYGKRGGIWGEVDIYVRGICPNCKTYFHRRVSAEEQCSPRYQEMAKELLTAERAREMLAQPFNI